MGKFRQTTVDRWKATGMWLTSGKKDDRIEDYMPDALWKQQAKDKPKVKPSKKRKP